MTLQTPCDMTDRMTDYRTKPLRRQTDNRRKPVNVELLKAQYAEGWTFHQLAKFHRIATGTVWRRLKEEGVKTIPPGEVTRRKYSIPKPQRVAGQRERKRRRSLCGFTQSEIADGLAHLVFTGGDGTLWIKIDEAVRDIIVSALKGRR